jgi:hypothetical protein
MAYSRGPKTITEDLIFHYDTGNEKSLVGEPTTNLATNLDLYDMGLGLTYLGVEDGWKKYSMGGTWSGGGYPYSVALGAVSFTGGLSYSTRATIKTNVEYKFNYFGTSGINYVNEPKNSSGTSTAILNGDGSRTVSTYNFAYTNTTTQLGYLLTNPINGITFNPSTDFIWLKDYQVEQKSHVTPFVSGTRSNTQSLLDLSKRSVMTVANASFDSNAMLNFDGTNDYAQLTSFPQPTNYITCEAWINPQDLVTPGTIRGGVISSTNSMYLGIFDSYDGTTFGSHWAVQTSTGARPYNVNGSIPRNQWTHLVGTYNGSVSRVYINGVEVWNASLTGTIPSATYYIGTYGGTIVDDTHNFNGYIPVAKIYNRSLTAEQVYQNYNASKSRFGL